MGLFKTTYYVNVGEFRSFRVNQNKEVSFPRNYRQSTE